MNTQGDATRLFCLCADTFLYLLPYLLFPFIFVTRPLHLIFLLICPLPFPLTYSFFLRLLEKNFMPSLCQNYTLCNKVDVAQWQSAGLSISRSVVLIQVGRYFFSFSFASCDIKNTIIIFRMYKKITSSHLL